MFEDMKLKDLSQLINLLKDKDSNESFLEIGKSYFIRTVTMNHTGTLIDFNKKELLLKDASWIADSGRFHDALKNGDLNEVEPFVSNVIVNRDCIVDVTEWKHDVPKVQK